MKKINNKLVNYTEDGKTIRGIFTTINSAKYILHNEKGFPRSSMVSYEPWVKKFGTQYEYYTYGVNIKSVTLVPEVYELWD